MTPTQCFERNGEMKSDGIEPLHAAAIVLAGGNSGRMGRDKAMLPLRGRPLIEHVVGQLRPHFQSVLISANDTAKFAFLGIPVVPDTRIGVGPLVGILSALEASSHDLNFVIACDIPEAPLDVVRRLLDEAPGFDAVVPRSSDGWLEPLFAVYRKTMIPAFGDLIESGGRKIRDAFERRAVRYVDLGETAWLRNINTPEDYEDLVAPKNAEDTAAA